MTKDVQDSILADSARAAVVDVIDIRYWYYQQDGKVYAPKGGQGLAPRQHERLLHPKRPSFAQVYRCIREYRDQFPAKAILYSAEGCDEFGWAVFMAGGSLANIPAIADRGFLVAAEGMKPVNLPDSDKVWALGGPGGYIVYSVGAGPVRLDPGAGRFCIHRIHASDGMVEKEVMKVKGGKMIEVPTTGKGPVVLWIEKS